MKSFARFARIGLAGAAAAALAGCAILRTPAPEQLYRFGYASPAAAAAPSTDLPPVQIALERTNFRREAAGNRIVTVEGPQVSYLAQARWAAPAPQLFEEAVVNAFDAAPSDIGFAPRRALGAADALLGLDVRRFEADYVNGAGAPPVVRVHVTARMVRRSDRQLIGERDFVAEAPASENRVSSVVQAYDQAVAQSLSQVVPWTVDTARRAGLGRRS